MSACMVCVYVCTERVVRFRSNDSSSNGEVGRSQVGLERQPLRLCYVCVLCSCGWGGFRAGGRAGSVGERNGSTTGSVCLE